MLFLIGFGLSSQSQDFITEWTFSSANLLIRFEALTADGPVNYTWSASPSGNSGSGSFTQTTAGSVTLTDLSAVAGDIVTLSMTPTNLRRFFMNSTLTQSLTNVQQWGSVPWSSMQFAFRGCQYVQISATDIPNLAEVTDMSSMFEACASLNSPSNINDWDVSAVKNMRSIFNGASAFNQDIGNWNTAAVTNMSYMFNRATIFDQDIGNWNTSAVVDMSDMFNGAHEFNQDIGNWDTSAVKKMGDMFHSAYVFNQDIGNWDTSACTTMQSMFMYAYAFNQDIGNWNTSEVTAMHNMFTGASSFNQDIGDWDTSAVRSMNRMFTSASAFNQDIGNWSLYPLVSLFDMLDNSGMDCDNYSATLVGWEANNPTVVNRDLGAINRIYGTSAVAARTILVNTRGWTINDSTNGDLCDASLSVLDYDIKKQFIIYPNPAKGHLTVNYKTNQTYDIAVYTSLGKLLTTYEKAKSSFQVPVEHLAIGLYFISVKDESGKTTTLKFVKNN